MKHLLAVSILIAAGVLTGCGCDAIGYPAVEVSVQDRASGQPVPLGGATVRYEGEVQPPHEETYPAATSAATFSICCTPGQWAVHIAKPGYAPYDTSVHVRSGGRCERPVLVRLLARLQPLPPAPAARAVRSVVPAV